MSKEPPCRATQQAPPTSTIPLVISDEETVWIRSKSSGCFHVDQCGTLLAPAGPVWPQSGSGKLPLFFFFNSNYLISFSKK